MYVITFFVWKKNKNSPNLTAKTHRKKEKCMHSFGIELRINCFNLMVMICKVVTTLIIMKKKVNLNEY